MTREGRADRPVARAAQARRPTRPAMNWSAAALLLAILALFGGLVVAAVHTGDRMLLAVLGVAFAGAYGLLWVHR